MTIETTLRDLEIAGACFSGRERFERAFGTKGATLTLANFDKYVEQVRRKFEEIDLEYCDDAKLQRTAWDDLTFVIPTVFPGFLAARHPSTTDDEGYSFWHQAENAYAYDREHPRAAAGRLLAAIRDWHKTAIPF